MHDRITAMMTFARRVATALSSHQRLEIMLLSTAFGWSLGVLAQQHTAHLQLPVFNAWCMAAAGLWGVLGKARHSLTQRRQGHLLLFGAWAALALNHNQGALPLAVLLGMLAVAELYLYLQMVTGLVDRPPNGQNHPNQ